MQKTQFLPIEQVHISDSFWHPILDRNRRISIPHIYRKLEETARLDAFKAAQPDPEPASLTKKDQFHIFYDSDVAKWLEAACFSLITHPDKNLREKVDQVTQLIIHAQQADGYLNTYFTVVAPEKRWKNLRDDHELYCAGHLMEAAVAHYYATGSNDLLHALGNYAKLINQEFGYQPEKKQGYPGHEEIELALVKMYRATGTQMYLDLSRYFVDQRGKQPHYYDAEARLRQEDPASYYFKTYEYNQAHVPVCEQKKVVGHAVRAMYLYCAMADLALEYKDYALELACERLWDDLTQTKRYITGGIGASRSNEGFTEPYDLPNKDAYAETCASIGLIFWAKRMLRLECHHKYSDIMEQALYNAFLAGISHSGDGFFYDNPLESNGSHQRSTFFSCACCPPNAIRLLASLGNYIYSQSDDSLMIHLYMQSRIQTTIQNTSFRLHQITEYPWDDTIRIKIEVDTPVYCTLKLRIPEWCDEPSITVKKSNHSSSSEKNTEEKITEEKNTEEKIEKTALPDKIEKGYVCLTDTWQRDDTIILHLPMKIKIIQPHPRIDANLGKAALMRGPIVYCVEQVDFSEPIHGLAIHPNTPFEPVFNPNLFDGIMTLQGTGWIPEESDWGESLYQEKPISYQPIHFTAIPYYCWANRESGIMKVWLNQISDTKE